MGSRCSHFGSLRQQGQWNFDENPAVPTQKIPDPLQKFKPRLLSSTLCGFGVDFGFQNSSKNEPKRLKIPIRNDVKKWTNFDIDFDSLLVQLGLGIGRVGGPFFEGFGLPKRIGLLISILNDLCSILDRFWTVFDRFWWAFGTKLEQSSHQNGINN